MSGFRNYDYLDDDGDLTDDTLDIIKNWDHKDAEALFQLIKQFWYLPTWGWEEKINEDGNKEYHLATGAGSVNRHIICALQKNYLLWHYTWAQSSRGGGYIFEIKKKEKEND